MVGSDHDTQWLCSICGGEIDEQVHPVSKEVYWRRGHNAQPINDGRCCSYCNDTVVLPRRLQDSINTG